MFAPLGCIPVRNLIVLLSTVASSLMYALRYNLSIAVIVMVKHPSEDIGNETDAYSFIDTSERCNITFAHPNKSHPAYADAIDNGEFEWSASEVGGMLSTYFIGYIFMQIGGGRLSEVWSAKWSMFLGVFVPGILTLVTPMAARWDYYALCAVRASIGIFTGLIYSAVYTLLSVWIPKEEKATALAIIMAGGNFGSVLTLPFVAWMCEAFGWPSSFYVIGILSISWSLLWAYYATDHPQKHSGVSPQELSVIEKGCIMVSGPKPKLRWGKVLTSMQVHSSSVAKSTGTFGYFIIGVMLPSYLDNVLQVPHQINGFLNAAVFLSMSVVQVFVGFFADWLRRKDVMSVTNLRKVFQTIAMVGPCVCMLIIPAVGCDLAAIIVLVMLSMVLYAFSNGGDMALIPDFAPEVAGSLFGYCNTFAIVMGVLAPIVCGWIVNNDIYSREKWDDVFYLSAGLYAFGMVFFNIFASAEVNEDLIKRPDIKDSNVLAVHHVEIQRTYSNL